MARKIKRFKVNAQNTQDSEEEELDYGYGKYDSEEVEYNPPTKNLQDLMEELDSRIVEDDAVVTIISRLTDGEKKIVLSEGNPYLNKISKGVSAEGKNSVSRIMDLLGARRAVKIKWLLRADAESSFDDVDDDTIIELINQASYTDLLELNNVLPLIKKELSSKAYLKVKANVDAALAHQKDEARQKQLAKTGQQEATFQPGKINTIMDKLYGLDAVYPVYKNYKAKYRSVYKKNTDAFITVRPSEEKTKDLEKDRKNLLTLLNRFGFKSIEEFEDHVINFEKEFRNFSVQLAKIYLDKYTLFLAEQNKKYDNDKVTSSLFDQLAPFRKAFSEASDHADKRMKAFANAQNFYTSDESRQKQGKIFAEEDRKMKAANARATAVLDNLSKDHPILKEENLSEDKRLDKEKLAKVNSSKELKILIKNHIANRIFDVSTTVKNLEGDTNSNRVYKMDNLMQMSYAALGISKGSIYDQILRDRMSDIAKAELIVGVMVLIFAVALGIVSGGTGTVAVLAGISSLGLSSALAYEQYEDYKRESAEAGSGMRSDDPTVAWLVISLLGVGFEAALVARSMKLLGPIAKINTLDDVARFEEGVRRLQKVGQLDARIADKSLKLAQIKRIVILTEESLSKTLVAKPGQIARPEVYSKLTKLAYYSSQEGITSFEQFLLKVQKQWEKAKLSVRFTPEELTKLKQIWQEKKIMEALAGYDPKFVNYITQFDNAITNPQNRTVVWRVIRSDQSANTAMVAKNQTGLTKAGDAYTIGGHVGVGGRTNTTTPYISSFANKEAAIQRAIEDGARVVEIDLTKVNGKFFDLSIKEVRDNLLKGVSANNFANKSFEFLMVTDNIPVNAMKNVKIK